MVAQKEDVRKYKIALVVNEFFCDEYPPLGGFGLSAKNFAEFFNQDQSTNIEVIALLPPYRGQGPPPTVLHGTRIVALPHGPGSLPQVREALQQEQVKLLISIDYYPNYYERLAACPDIPWIHWARDPHSPDNWKRILELQKTQFPCEYKPKSKHRHKHYLKLQLMRRLRSRRFSCAVQETWMSERARAGFPLIGNNFYRLVNRIQVPHKNPVKSEQPTVLFIGRLLPVKRPWIYFEIAKRFPDVTFLVVGEMDARQHLKEVISGAQNIPNLKLLGKRTGRDLEDLLEKTWVLINTSIHEGMPQSILQALSYEVPVLSALGFGGTINRYGIQASEAHSDGLDEIEPFCRELSSLLNSDSKRTELGRAGLEFVKENYSDHAFQRQFSFMMESMGLMHRDTDGALVVGSRPQFEGEAGE